MPIQPQLEFSFGGGKPARNSRISLARNIYRFRKRLKQGLDDVVRFVAIEQFQMQVAAGFIGKRLKELAGESEPEDA